MAKKSKPQTVRSWRIRDTHNRFAYTFKQARDILYPLRFSRLSPRSKREIIGRLEKAAELAILVDEGLFHFFHLSSKAHGELSSILEALDSIAPILDRPVLSGEETLSVLETLAIHEGATPQDAIAMFRRFRKGLAEALEAKPARHGWKSTHSARRIFRNHLVCEFERATGQKATLANGEHTSPFEEFGEPAVRPTGLLRPGASAKAFLRTALSQRR